MKKWLGLALFLLVIYLLLLLADPGARSAYNHLNLGQRIGLYGTISLGAGILIITGGIDLSIGSTIGLCATVMAMLLIDYQLHPLVAIVADAGSGRRDRPSQWSARHQAARAGVYRHFVWAVHLSRCCALAVA